MANIIDTYPVLQRGLGAPDYSDTVSSSIDRAGVRIKINETLRVYGRSLNLGGDAEYPFVLPSPLVADANTHLTDFETMAPMPIVVPAGYTLTIIDIGTTASQDMQMYAYIDAWSVNCLSAMGGGGVFYQNKVLGLSTSWVDVAAAAAHDFDIKIYNVGTSDLYAGIMVVCVLAAVGTPPLPATKDCHCPHCGRVQTESIHVTKIKCKGCGKEYGVYDFSKVGR